MSPIFCHYAVHFKVPLFCHYSSFYFAIQLLFYHYFVYFFCQYLAHFFAILFLIVLTLFRHNFGISFTIICRFFCGHYSVILYSFFSTIVLPLFHPFPAGNCMFKVNKRNTRARWEISNLTIKTPQQRQWRRSGCFIVIFEHISHLVLVFLLLTLSR